MAKEQSERLASILGRGGINFSSAKVYGSFAHIDTFKKYEARLVDVMGQAGFRLHSTRDGVHLDDYRGFRMIFVLGEGK
jgi:outer membrane biogenesis lipoprotein LolB